MANDRVVQIGCGAVLDEISANNNKLFLACDYSYTNMLNEPVYTVGESGSQCKVRHEVFTSLCA